MTDQLPAYLQNRATRGLAQRATQGMGSVLPPRISIQGNSFTLIDAAGNEISAGNTIEAVIVDIGDVLSKRYYANQTWTPDSNDPPLCWSSNGIGPSREAAQPQARTCAECPQNVRGSAVSKISGAAIKACRDELPLALLLPKYPAVLFQLTVTPGSFKNWTPFAKQFEGRPIDLDAVLTRISFEPKVNGVLQFQAISYTPADVIGHVDQALLEKKTDVLVGRLDRPRENALPSPTPAPQIAAQPVAQPAAAPATLLPGPSAPATPQFPSGAAPAGAVATASAEAPTPRRRGRPKAAEQAPPTGPVAAPFRPADPPSAGTPFQPTTPPANCGGAPFGIGPGVAPNADLQKALDQAFPLK